MASYDATHYNPPAPVAMVVLRISTDLSGAASVPDVPLLIDTGADITLIPRSAVQRLGVTLLPAQYEVLGIDGKTRTTTDGSIWICSSSTRRSAAATS